MIGYIEGKVIKTLRDGILLLAGQVGYEILLPTVVLEQMKSDLSDQLISLYIYFNQTERQPKPVLIGFNTEDEKEFFQLFISVDAIGPMKAVKAMEKPIAQIAKAIEEKDVKFLASLKGIGKRTAEKIIVSLYGKTGHFAPIGNYDDKDGDSSSYVNTSASIQKISEQVVGVLIEQLGYTSPIAKKMVANALERDSSIITPEQLFDEVYKEGVLK